MCQTKAHNFYNMGAEDLAELKSGDTVRLIPPRILTNEAVKAKVNKPVGIRSYEAITEDGARYRRNRRHLRKIAEYYDISTLARNLNLTPSPSKQAEEAVTVPVVSEKGVSPLKQAERAAVVPAVSEQTEACPDPVTLQRQSESSDQPMAVSCWSSKQLSLLFKVAEHSFQEPIPNSPLLLSYLSFGARFLQESRLTTEEFILAFWLRCELLPWQRG